MRWVLRMILASFPQGVNIGDVQWSAWKMESAGVKRVNPSAVAESRIVWSAAVQVSVISGNNDELVMYAPFRAEVAIF